MPHSSELTGIISLRASHVGRYCLAIPLNVGMIFTNIHHKKWQYSLIIFFITSNTQSWIYIFTKFAEHLTRLLLENQNREKKCLNTFMIFCSGFVVSGLRFWSDETTMNKVVIIEEKRVWEKTGSGKKLSTVEFLFSWQNQTFLVTENQRTLLRSQCS